MARGYMAFCCLILHFTWHRVPWWIHEICQRILLGKITDKITGTINGTACEVEYHGRFGMQVGFWAYGSFDPQYPFLG
jgi:hypothetical protein